VSAIKSCSFCQRVGLPIFVVRPSVALKTDSFPELKSEWSPGLEVPEYLSPIARSLTDGFVYVYSEKYETLDIYSVTERGDFYRVFLDSAGNPPKVKSQPCASCNDGMESWQAKTVSIHINPAASNGVYWFGWSETLWSKEIQDNHIKNTGGCRIKNMVSFSVDQWAAQRGGVERKQGEALPFHDIADYVADYAFDIKDKSAEDEVLKRYQAFDHRAEVKGEQVSKTTQISALSKAVAGNTKCAGAYVCIKDPVSIIKDIMVTRHWLVTDGYYPYQTDQGFTGPFDYKTGPAFRKENGTALELFERKVQLSGMYHLATQMLDQAFYNAEIEKKYEQYQKSYSDFRSGYLLRAGIFANETLLSYEGYSKRHMHADKDRELFENKTKEKLIEQERYYQKHEWESFDYKYKKDRDEFYAQIIMPLEELAQLLMNSEELMLYYQHSYSQNNLEDGLEFLDSIIALIEHLNSAVNVANETSKFIEDKPEFDFKGFNGCLQRATLLNQENEISSFKKLIANEEYINVGKVLADFINVALSLHAQRIESSINNLIALTQSKFVDLATNSTRQKIPYLFPILSAYSQQQVYTISLELDGKGAMKAFTQQLKRIRHDSSSWALYQQLLNTIAEENYTERVANTKELSMTRYKKLIDNVSLKGKHTVQFLVSLDKEVVSALKRDGAEVIAASTTQGATIHLKPNQLQTVFESRVELLGDLPKDGVLTQTGRGAGAAKNFELTNHVSSNLAINGFMTALQLGAFVILTRNFFKEDSTSTRARAQLMSSAALLVGSFAQAADTVLVARNPDSAWAKGSSAASESSSKLARAVPRTALKKIAQYSQIGGVVLGIMDVEKGVKYGLQGDRWIGAGFVGAGVAGAGLSFLAFLGVIPIAGQVFIIGMVITASVLVLLSFQEDTLEPFQEWFVRSYWGDHSKITMLKDGLAKYPTHLQEKGAYQQAFGIEDKEQQHEK